MHERADGGGHKSLDGTPNETETISEDDKNLRLKGKTSMAHTHTNDVLLLTGII